MEQKWQKEGQKGYHQTYTSPFLRRGAYLCFYSHMQLPQKLLQCFFQASPRSKLFTQKAKGCPKRQKDGLAGNRTLDHSHTESLENDTDAKGVLYH
jgi:hypothetical protein